MQLEKINSQAVFAREQDRLEMIRVLHAASVESDNVKDLDIEILLNLKDGIFKPEDEAAGDEQSLQAALTIQVRRTNYENRGMATQKRKVPKKNSDTRSPKQSVSDFSKLLQVVFYMKAKMGCMRKAMVNAGMSFDKSPNEPRPRDHLVNGKQKNDDDVYKGTPTPGQLFTNKWGDAPDWVLLPEGVGGAKGIITPWPADCKYYPPSPKKDIGGRTKASTRLPIQEGCFV